MNADWQTLVHVEMVIYSFVQVKGENYMKI